jgi:hypothetical protein
MGEQGLVLDAGFVASLGRVLAIRCVDQFIYEFAASSMAWLNCGFSDLAAITFLSGKGLIVEHPDENPMA